MISTAQLVYKLNLQSTFLEKYLNLPLGFGKDPLAKAIYQHFNFDDICAWFSDEGEKINLSHVLDNNKLKYLLICEIDDKELIKELHQEIEKMALRIEELVIISITRIQLISVLYKLFGLEEQSKYIIDSDHLELDWHPYFKTIENDKAVLFSDIQVNSVPFRLIATKFNVDEISVDTFIEQIKAEMKKSDHIAYENLKSHVEWFSRSIALLTKPNSNNTDEFPEYFRIDGEEYVTFGFPHCPTLSVEVNEPFLEINFLIKNTFEKQKFILNISQQKLTLECQVLDDVKDDQVRYSNFCHQIKGNLFSHKDACAFPITFKSGYCFFWIRPYRHTDFLENAL